MASSRVTTGGVGAQFFCRSSSSSLSFPDHMPGTAAAPSTQFCLMEFSQKWQFCPECSVGIRSLIFLCSQRHRGGAKLSYLMRVWCDFPGIVIPVVGRGHANVTDTDWTVHTSAVQTTCSTQSELQGGVPPQLGSDFWRRKWMRFVSPGLSGLLKGKRSNLWSGKFAGAAPVPRRFQELAGRF